MDISITSKCIYNLYKHLKILTMGLNIVKTFNFNIVTVIFSKDKKKTSVTFRVIPRPKKVLGVRMSAG